MLGLFIIYCLFATLIFLCCAFLDGRGLLPDAIRPLVPVLAPFWIVMIPVGILMGFVWICGQIYDWVFNLAQRK